MTRTKPPQVPEALSDLLRDDQLKALLATCDKGIDRWCNEEEKRRVLGIISIPTSFVIHSPINGYPKVALKAT